MLIVTDLDGTLLNEEGKLTDYTKKILKEVSKDNILIAASGRGLTGIKAALEDIYSYFSYFICGNGSFIYHKDELIYEKSLSKKLLRWQKIAKEAAKQCGRGIIPTIDKTADFSEIKKLVSPENTGILFYECSTVPLKDAVSNFKKNVDIVIGSEGGFEPSEAEELQKLGFAAVSLGKRILRCETAPIAALSVLMNMTGNM